MLLEYAYEPIPACWKNYVQKFILTMAWTTLSRHGTTLVPKKDFITTSLPARSIRIIIIINNNNNNNNSNNNNNNNNHNNKNRERDTYLGRATLTRPLSRHIWVVNPCLGKEWHSIPRPVLSNGRPQYRHTSQGKFALEGKTQWGNHLECMARCSCTKNKNIYYKWLLPMYTKKTQLFRLSCLTLAGKTSKDNLLSCNKYNDYFMIHCLI